MKPYVVTYMTKKGKIKEKGFQNGLKSIQIIEPSQWYEDNVMKPHRVIAQKERDYEEKQLKVARKMKEMAEKEIEKERKL